MKHLASRSMVFALLFTGSDLFQNKEIHFPKKDAKASVVVFLSAKCPCSASHEKTISELAEKYSKNGFEFIGVHSNQNESVEVAKSHFKESGITFPIIEDHGSKISNQLKALKTPHVYIIEKDKIVYEGGVDDSADAAEAKIPYLANALKELSENKPITVSKTRALGCQIKR